MRELNGCGTHLTRKGASRTAPSRRPFVIMRWAGRRSDVCARLTNPVVVSDELSRAVTALGGELRVEWPDRPGMIDNDRGVPRPWNAAVAERPGVMALEVCGVLGALAGVTVAQSLPVASTEVDEVHLDAMVRSYCSALLERVRETGEVV